MGIDGLVATKRLVIVSGKSVTETDVPAGEKSASIPITVSFEKPAVITGGGGLKEELEGMFPPMVKALAEVALAAMDALIEMAEIIAILKLLIVFICPVYMI